MKEVDVLQKGIIGALRPGYSTYFYHPTQMVVKPVKAAYNLLPAEVKKEVDFGTFETVILGKFANIDFDSNKHKKKYPALKAFVEILRDEKATVVFGKDEDFLAALKIYFAERKEAEIAIENEVQESYFKAALSETEANKQYQDERKKAEELGAQVARLTTQVGNAKSFIEQSDGEVKSLKEKLVAAEKGLKELEALREERSIYETSVTALKKENDEKYDELLNRSANTVSDLYLKLHAATDENVAQKKQYERQVENLAKIINERELKLDAATKQNTTLTAQNGALTTKGEDLAKKVKKLEKDKEELESKFAIEKGTLETQLGNLRSQNTQLTNNCTTLTTDNGGLENYKRILNVQNTGLNAALAASTKSLNRMKICAGVAAAVAVVATVVGCVVAFRAGMLDKIIESISSVFSMSV